MNNRDRQICDKLLSEIAILKDMMDGVSHETFLTDERTSRAVCMTLINIGELVKNLTDELRDSHKEIPWRAGMRDITAHKYQTLRMDDVYNTCVEDIPTFESQIKALIQE
jgi:uncharacterized protein with HEPN domain